jgi:hypothetical protein
MKVPSGILAMAYFAAIGLLLVWGAWLVVANDPDGGRHPAGAVMLVVAVVFGVVGLVSFRRFRRL